MQTDRQLMFINLSSQKKDDSLLHYGQSSVTIEFKKLVNKLVICSNCGKVAINIKEEVASTSVCEGSWSEREKG